MCFGSSGFEGRGALCLGVDAFKLKPKLLVSQNVPTLPLIFRFYNFMCVQSLSGAVRSLREGGDCIEEEEEEAEKYLLYGMDGIPWICTWFPL